MKILDLRGDWRLVRIATGDTVPARVPGDTHSALLAAGVIPDPFVGTNELAVQWVGREDWAWERDFMVEDEILSQDAVLLVCDSLDTVAEVFFNGKLLGRADNMFTRFCFDAKPHLRPGKNAIRIFFHSAEREAAKAAGGLPYPVPHTRFPVDSPHRNLVRKVQCHSGWDWGPCLMVAGIYGGIRLEATSAVRIEYVYTEQKHAAGRCRMRVFVECRAFRSSEYELSVSFCGQKVEKKVKLDAGPRRLSVDITVENPRLWWPNGFGEQPLYDLEVRLSGHSVTKRIGLRTLELVTRTDRVGASMVFRVNGIDIFCKGANWIPCDALPQRQTRERVEHLLSSCVKVHMNMLRVWGGGQYESEDFYDLCDEKGLLVWQDMMFACALYPAVPDFLARVDAEARHQIKRLRDHPSIALWCGNNENFGALSWYAESKQDRDRYIADYDRLYEGVIGKAVDECDPTRAFWPSSPSGGRSNYSDNWHDDRRGDMHFWSVWQEGKPFQAYREVSPRFCSEFGYQSFPSLETVKSYAGEDSLSISSPIMEHHQRHPGGNARITEMMTRYFRFPRGFESFLYLSQVQQALAMKIAVEHWRHLRPLCMGTLYWQLNDNWPVCSWSSIEYGGKWKLVHYAAARFYAPVLLAASPTDAGIEIWLVNDTLQETKGTVEWSVIGFNGSRGSSGSLRARVPAGSSKLVGVLSQEELTSAPEREFLFLKHTPEKGKVFSNEHFFADYKRCAIEKAEIRVEAEECGDGLTVRLTTDKPAFFVSLDTGAIPGEFDDNCFTLLDGAPRSLFFTPRRKVSLEDLRGSLTVHHLRNTYE
jgi:beta-mannosidase